MQVGGIGNEHNSSMHHITNCVHDHGTTHKKTGAAAALGAPQADLVTTNEPQNDTGFSLSAWLADPLGNAKKLLGRIWHGGDGNSGVSGNVSGDTGGQEGIKSAFNPGVLHGPQVAAAAVAGTPRDFVRDNPYFSAVEDTGRQSEAFWRKIKVKFQGVMGHLTKRFSFSGGDSFQARQEQSKEDLRKKSHYKGEDLEMDCVLTDESYLMDSYNRKGEYRQLSTKK